MATVADADTPTPWVALAAVTAAVSVFAIAQGLSYPLFTFLMQAQGLPPATIGLSAAMTPLGIIVASPFIPWATRTFGAQRLAVCCSLVAAVLYLYAGWLQNGFAWFALRFLIGVAIDPLYVISETWLIQLAPPARRGRFVSMYTAIVGAGFAAGPLTLLLVGTEGMTPFVIGAAALAGCALFLYVMRARLPSIGGGHEQVTLMSFVVLAPALLLAVAVTAGFEQSVLAMLPVYGLTVGIEEQKMAALLTVMIAGNIALQFPIGLAAEKVRPRLVLLGCAALTIVLTALLPLVITGHAAWPLLFVLGAASYGIYTAALIELGSRFSGQALVAGNAAFALTWGIGGIAAPPSAGFAMQWAGPVGLPVVLAGMCVILVLFAGWREWHRR